MLHDNVESTHNVPLNLFCFYLMFMEIQGFCDICMRYVSNHDLDGDLIPMILIT